MTIQDKPIQKPRRRRRHRAGAVLAPCLQNVRTASGQDADAMRSQCERIPRCDASCTRHGSGVTQPGRNVTRNADATLGPLQDQILEVDDTDPATRGVQLLAQAYGAGQSFDRAGARYVLSSTGWEPTDPRTGEGDESRPAASPGLSLVRETETLLRASRAINEKDREQKRLLARATSAVVEEARRWSDAHSLRKPGRGNPYRVTEFDTWTRAEGIAFVPMNPSGAKVVRALSRAGLTGPFPHLLLFAATHELSHWRKVEPFLIACGHPAWACDVVALEFFGLDRTIADGAKAAGVRAETYLRERDRARRRVDGWLERAAPRIAERLHESGSLVGEEVYMVDGDVRVRDGGQPARPSRDPSTFNCDEPSALMVETWWHPERLGMDRFGRRTGPRGGLVEAAGDTALVHCKAHPSQGHLVGGEDPVLIGEDRSATRDRARHKAEDDGYLEPHDVKDLTDLMLFV